MHLPVVLLPAPQHAMGVNHCEAMVRVGRTWARCGRRDTDLHHRLTRARGGLILDEAGETYHLMYLCRHHHSVAHDAPAFENGLLLDGYVTTAPDGRPLYTGSDQYLSKQYGSVPMC